MKILIAPDSFKESLNANEFCDICNEQILKLNPQATINSIPFADGGEGTIEAILSNVNGVQVNLKVQNALGQYDPAIYAILEDKQTAIIEVAQASGLAQIPLNKRNPLFTSSYGSGELIVNALDRGCRNFIIGLGGSATNDAGMGVLAALGARFFNGDDEEIIHFCGKNLLKIVHIDLSQFDKRILESEVIIAADVTNPLLGKEGATYTYGAQKGASDEVLLQLEKGMKNFSIQSELLLPNGSLENVAGAGAAGGIGFTLMAYCQATIKSGFEVIAELVNLDKLFSTKATRPDFIITGEGSFDIQSLNGKVVSRLLERAERYDIPLIVLCGRIGNDLDIKTLSPNMSVFSLCYGPISLEDAISESKTLLEKLIYNIAKLLFSESGKTK